MRSKKAAVTAAFFLYRGVYLFALKLNLHSRLTVPFLVDLQNKKIYNYEDCEYTKSGGFNLNLRLQLMSYFMIV